MEKVTFIATVLNEEKTIDVFLDSIISQKYQFDEIIIVDGGSTDNTLSVIANFKLQISNKSQKIKVFQKQGNRSVGRNYAIQKSSHEIILCSDAGCILDKNWSKEIMSKFKKDVDAVAGYYKGEPHSSFERCLVPYVLVMSDQAQDDFLPASRSMAFRKSVWRELGGFPEEFSFNEDYVFAKRLKEHNKRIIFAKDAIVYWIPPSTIENAFFYVL